MAVASAGPYANNLHLAPDRTTTPHHSISTGRMLFLTPKKQCQSNGGTYYYHYYYYDKIKTVEIKMLVTEDIFRLLPYWLEKMKTVFIEK